MPQKRDRRRRVLDWNDVYAQFAQAAASLPMEDVDRDLAARGYDLDRLRGAAGRLGRRTGAPVAGGMSIPRRSGRADAILPAVPPSVPLAVTLAGRAPQRNRMRRRATRGALAGVVGAALLAWLAVPVSETGAGRQPAAPIAKTDEPAHGAGPHVKIAEANPAGVDEDRDANSGSPVIAKPPYSKAAALKKCGVGFKGSCAKAVPAGDEHIRASAGGTLTEHDAEDKGVVVRPKDAEAPRLVAMAPMGGLRSAS